MDLTLLGEEEGSAVDLGQANLPSITDFTVRATSSVGDVARETGPGDTGSRRSKVKLSAEDLQPGPPRIELSHRQKQDIKNAFNVFDTDGTGTMLFSDMHVALRALGFEPTKREIQKLVSHVDKAHTGKLCFTDFLDVILFKLSETDCKDEILRAFKLFDWDNTGKISYENLLKVGAELGEGLNDEEVMEMITTADLNGDGTVDPEEFYRIMKKTGIY